MEREVKPVHNFCRKCGKTLKPNEKFCSRCGTPTMSEEEAVSNNVETQTEEESIRNKSFFLQQKNKIIIAVIAVFLFVGGGIYYMTNENKEGMLLEKDKISDVGTTDLQVEKKTKQSVVTPFQIIQNEFSQRGISGTVIATSYGHNPDGCLVVLGGKGIRLVAWDIKNNRIAYINSNGSNIFSFIGKKSYNTLDPVIFNMTIPQDIHDKDAKAGSWRGTEHLIPIYAFYELNDSGSVEPGRIYTGAGDSPSHYHDYLYEMKNVEMVNLVLTEMVPLKENAKIHNVRLD